MKIEAGKLAIAKAGHDRGKIYVIMGWEDGFLKLMDGKKYDGKRYKKKNPKHIEPTNGDYRLLLSDADKTGKRTIFNKEDIALAIKLFKESHDCNAVRKEKNV